MRNIRSSILAAGGLAIIIAGIPTGRPASGEDQPLASSKPSGEVFSLGMPGVGSKNGTLLVATRLINNSSQSAFGVQIESIKLNSAILLMPTRFPVLLNEIGAGQNMVFQANFASNQLTQGQQYNLVVKGVYRVKKENDKPGLKSPKEEANSMLIRLTPKLTIGSVGAEVRCRRLGSHRSAISGLSPPVPTPLS